MTSFFFNLPTLHQLNTKNLKTKILDPAKSQKFNL